VLVLNELYFWTLSIGGPRAIESQNPTEVIYVIGMDPIYTPALGYSKS
jgi:hypothetical protein